MTRARRKREPPQERRSAFRFPVSGPRRDGCLQLGKQQFDVVIVDESAGGFAIEFNHLADCHVGDTLLLRVAEDWFQVRVAFLEMQDLGVERFTGCDLKSHTRLGLRRMTDEECWAPIREEEKRHWFRFRRPRVYLRKDSLIVAAISILVGLVIVGGALMRTMDRSKPLDPYSDDGSKALVADVKDPLVLAPQTGLALEREVRKQLGSSEGDAPGAAPPILKPIAGRRVSQPDSQPNVKHERKYQAPYVPSLPAGLLKGPADAAETAVEAAEKLVPAIELRPETLRLVQPAFLLRPDVSKKLDLTETQQVHLRRLLVELRTADQSLSKALTEEDPELVLGHRSLGILTSQQQRVLVDLRAKLPPEATPPANAEP